MSHRAKRNTLGLCAMAGCQNEPMENRTICKSCSIAWSKKSYESRKARAGKPPNDLEHRRAMRRHTKKVDIGTRAPFQPGFNALPLISTKKPRDPLTRHVNDALNCKTVAQPIEKTERARTEECRPRAARCEIKRREMPSLRCF